MKNTLSGLNNHLFEQLERLNDKELTEEQLEQEFNLEEEVDHVRKDTDTRRKPGGFLKLYRSMP